MIADHRVSCLRYEARRICDRDGIDDLATLDKVHASLVWREFQREIQPIIDAKARVLGTAVTQIWLRSDGTIETKYILTEAQQAALDVADALIARIADQYRTP